MPVRLGWSLTAYISVYIAVLYAYLSTIGKNLLEPNVSLLGPTLVSGPMDIRGGPMRAGSARLYPLARTLSCPLRGQPFYGWGRIGSWATIGVQRD